jgi:ATP-dependent helicase/nuclease subunit B
MRLPWTCKFLGWDQPAIDLTVEFAWQNGRLAERVELSNHLLIVPTASARRDLLFLLAQRAEQEGILLLPPTVITVGQIDLYLLPPEPRRATSIERELAWFATLSGAGAAVRESLLGKGPAADHAQNIRRYARLLVELDDQLAAENHSLADVAQALPDEEPAGRARWEEIGRLWTEYVLTLERAERIDPAWHRRAALAEPLSPHPGPVWLFGVVDLRPASLSVLKASAAVGTVISSLVIAPQDQAVDFDIYGRLNRKRWINRPIAIDDAKITVVADPAAESLAVIEILNQWSDVPPREITVGIVDTEIVPRLACQAKRFSRELDYFHLPKPSRSAPLSLLTHLLTYLEQDKAEDLARLVRHPDFADYLASKAALLPSALANDIDQLRSRRLPRTIPARQLFEREGLSWAEHLLLLVDRWPRKRCSLADWLTLFSKLLLAVYEQATDPQVLLDIEHVGNAMQQAADLPATLTDMMTSLEAWEIVASFYSPEQSPRVLDAGTIRGQGWLDLPFDRAGYVILAGMNEERLGTSPAAAFLTESVCRQLDLSFDEERKARDRYALAMILASRKDVRFLMARTSAAKDPLTPSSLLLADSATVRARRLLMFFSDEIIERRIVYPGSNQIRLTPPTPDPAATIQHLRVTAFRDYLMCPYRFYLRHVCKLTTVDDQETELDSPTFGSLFHEIFEAFGKSSVVRSTDADQIADFLEAEWLDIERGRFADCLPTVLLQGEQMKRRLRAFANWQADRTRQGWEIVHVELEALGTSAPLWVDDEPFYLRGRIDRVDVNRSTGELAIIDYKTGDSMIEPDKQHRSKEMWVDLQLPLYRHLLPGTAIDPSILDAAAGISLGYICIPKAIEDTNYYPAPWSTEELDDADQVAADVVRGLRLGIFEPRSNNEEAVRRYPEFSRLCQDGMLGHE